MEECQISQHDVSFIPPDQVGLLTDDDSMILYADMDNDDDDGNCRGLILHNNKNNRIHNTSAVIAATTTAAANTTTATTTTNHTSHTNLGGGGILVERLDEGRDVLHTTFHEERNLRKNLTNVFDQLTTATTTNTTCTAIDTSNNATAPLLGCHPPKPLLANPLQEKQNNDDPALQSVAKKIARFEEQTAHATVSGRVTAATLLLSNREEFDKEQQFAVYLRLRPCKGPSTVEIIPVIARNQKQKQHEEEEEEENNKNKEKKNKINNNNNDNHKKKTKVAMTTTTTKKSSRNGVSFPRIIRTVAPETSNAHKVARNQGPGPVTKEYEFKAVLGPETSQQSVYRITVQPYIRGVCQGQSALVFCYGITNAGKTYTVLGSDAALTMKSSASQTNTITTSNNGTTNGTPEPWGLVPRAVQDLVEHCYHDRYQNKKLALIMSYFEIYNEQVYDLLASTTTMPQIGGRKTNYTDNAILGPSNKKFSTRTIKTLADGLACIRLARKNRRSGTNQINQDSSRSHAICQLRVVNQQSKDSADLWIVDLAGSERFKRTGGNRHHEAAAINQSLTTLNRCLAALRHSSSSSSSQDNGRIIPWRESKLTRLFAAHWMGPYANRTAMVVNVNPGINDFDETQHVLAYAAVAKAVRTDHIMAARYYTSSAMATRNTRNNLGADIEGAVTMTVEYDLDGRRRTVISGGGSSRSMTATLSSQNNQNAGSCRATNTAGASSTATTSTTSVAQKVAKVMQRLSPKRALEQYRKRKGMAESKHDNENTGGGGSGASSMMNQTMTGQTKEQQPRAKKPRPLYNEMEKRLRSGTASISTTGMGSTGVESREVQNLKMQLSIERAESAVLKTRYDELQEKIETMEQDVRNELAEEMETQMHTMRQQYEAIIDKIQESHMKNAGNVSYKDLLEVDRLQNLVQDLKDRIEECEDEVKQLQINKQALENRERKLLEVLSRLQREYDIPCIPECHDLVSATTATSDAELMLQDDDEDAATVATEVHQTNNVSFHDTQFVDVLDHGRVSEDSARFSTTGSVCRDDDQDGCGVHNEMVIRPLTQDAIVDVASTGEVNYDLDVDQFHGDGSAVDADVDKIIPQEMIDYPDLDDDCVETTSHEESGGDHVDEADGDISVLCDDTTTKDDMRSQLEEKTDSSTCFSNPATDEDYMAENMTHEAKAETSVFGKQNHEDTENKSGNFHSKKSTHISSPFAPRHAQSSRQPFSMISDVDNLQRDDGTEKDDMLVMRPNGQLKQDPVKGTYLRPRGRKPKDAESWDEVRGVWRLSVVPAQHRIHD